MTVDATAAVRVWSLTNRKIARTFERQKDESIAAGDCDVTALCVRGDEIVLGTKDGFMEMWSIGGGLLLPAFSRHKGMLIHTPAHADLCHFQAQWEGCTLSFPFVAEVCPLSHMHMPRDGHFSTAEHPRYRSVAAPARIL